MKFTGTKDCYTACEAAKLLHVSYGTLHLWGCKGFIKPFKTLGGHRRYSADEVKRVFYEIYGEHKK